MSGGSDVPFVTAAKLKEEFDAAFAREAATETGSAVDLVEIVVDRHGYAIRIDHAAGLFAGRQISPIPSRFPGLLGITGLRGAIVPVYDVGVLLAHGERANPPRWLIVTRGDRQVGFAFDSFGGHLRVPAESVVVNGAEGAGANFVSEVVSAGGVTRPVIDVPALVRHIAERADKQGR